MPQLTDREFDVLRALQQGKPNKIIAHDLRMSEATVKCHVQHIFKKLKVTNRTQAAVFGNQRSGGNSDADYY